MQKVIAEFYKNILLCVEQPTWLLVKIFFDLWPPLKTTI